MADHPDLGIKYDPEAAKAELQSYLDEKGVTADSLDLTLVFNTSSGHQKIAEAIQQMWKENLGVDVKLANQEWAVFLQSIRDPQATPQIYRLGWCSDYADANNFIREVFVKGGSANPKDGGGVNYENPAFEDLGEGGPGAGPAGASSLYAQAEGCSWTPMPSSPIYWYTSPDVTKPYVARTTARAAEAYNKWDISK
jgi:oligopeptide transport system substrate-binding protein